MYLAYPWYPSTHPELPGLVHAHIIAVSVKCTGFQIKYSCGNTRFWSAVGSITALTMAVVNSQQRRISWTVDTIASAEVDSRLCNPITFLWTSRSEEVGRMITCHLNYCTLINEHSTVNLHKNLYKTALLGWGGVAVVSCRAVWQIKAMNKTVPYPIKGNFLAFEGILLRYT